MYSYLSFMVVVLQTIHPRGGAGGEGGRGNLSGEEGGKGGGGVLVLQ